MTEIAPVVLGKTEIAPIAKPPEKPAQKSFGAVLKAMGEETRRGEKLVQRASSGVSKDLSPGELIALQAGVYRYVEVIDLSSKLVDRATQGAKTLVQGNG